MATKMTERLVAWCSDEITTITFDDCCLPGLRRLAIKATSDLQFVVPVRAIRIAMQLVATARFLRACLDEADLERAPK